MSVTHTRSSLLCSDSCSIVRGGGAHRWWSFDLRRGGRRWSFGGAHSRVVVQWCPFEGRCEVVPIRWSCSPWSFGGVVAIRWWSFNRLRQQWWPFSRLWQQWWSFSRLRQRWYNSLELSNRQKFHLFLHPIVMKC